MSAPGSGIGGRGDYGRDNRRDEADVADTVTLRPRSRQLREFAAAPEPEEASGAVGVSQDIPEPLTPEEITVMNLGEAQEHYRHLSQALQRARVNEKTKKRLWTDWRLVREQVRNLTKGGGVGGAGSIGGRKQSDEADALRKVADQEEYRQLREDAAASEPEDAWIAGEVQLESAMLLDRAEKATKDKLTDSDDAPVEIDGRAHAVVKQLAHVRIVLHPALLTIKEGLVLVTVLVTDNTNRTRRALAEAGLSIEAFSKSLPIVVGTIPAANLRGLALVPGVRRIEPTRMEREKGTR